jgi:IstB-like ATP binding protein
LTYRAERRAAPKPARSGNVSAAQGPSHRRPPGTGQAKTMSFPQLRWAQSIVSRVVAVQEASDERRGILITANQPLSGWTVVVPDPGMQVAAIDRLVHHSTIFELHNVESYRA